MYLLYFLSAVTFMDEPQPFLQHGAQRDAEAGPRGPAQKAFQINLDASKYGTFAEIGAGQEVARWFFYVGGAAGTVAKTMSAYDMVVSDVIYGDCPRYVSRERLSDMLDHEYELLVERLDEPRGDETTFFAFADTVAAKAHRGPDEGHGWVGIRFQTEPRSRPSQIELHVRLLDDENAAQQEALGIVGVNLVHAAFHHYEEPEALLKALLDDLKPGRVEIDMAEFSGEAFETIDHRLVGLQLVKHGLSRTAMFATDGTILQPSEALYKRPVLVERGTFQCVTHTHLDMMERARERFIERDDVDPERLVVLMEMTMQELEETGGLGYDDFLLRADMLEATGATVLVSNYLEHYHIVQYLDRLTSRPIGLVTGIATLQRLYQARFYEDLPGGLLEAFGLLFSGDDVVQMYVYPQLASTEGDEDARIRASSLVLDPPLNHFHRYLLESGRIEDLTDVPRELLQGYPAEVIEKLEADDSSWKELVPEAVEHVLRSSERYREMA